MRLVIRKDVYENICNMLGFEKAGLPIGTVHGEYKKIVDNPSKWEHIGNASTKKDKQLKELRELFYKYQKKLSYEEQKWIESKKKNCIPVYNSFVDDKNRLYEGHYYQHINREDKSETFNREEKFATILASLGFSVWLVDEKIEDKNVPNNKRIDAIVNGIPVDFKIIGLGNNAIKRNYQEGMEKYNCKGVMIQIATEQKYEIVNKDKQKIKVSLDTAVESYTKISNNGILSIWINDTEKMKSYDMKKIRAFHKEKALGKTL